MTHPLLLFGVLSEVELAALGWCEAVFPKKSHSGTFKIYIYGLCTMVFLGQFFGIW